MSADPFDTPVSDELDPFDAPAFDPATGELFDDPTDAERKRQAGLLQAGPGDEMLPFQLGQLAVSSVDYAAKRLQEYAGDLRSMLEERIGQRYSELVEARPPGPLTADGAQPELVWLADLHEVMGTIGKVFTVQAQGARQLAGEVVLEVRTDKPVERTGGSASVKVGAQRGAVKVTTTQPTEVYTNTPGIIDVLVSFLLGKLDSYPQDYGAGYATGARAMAAALLGLDGVVGLLAAPKWKSTALDLLRTQLQTLDPQVGVALAARLADAYGRRPKGEPTTTIERVDSVREVREL